MNKFYFFAVLLVSAFAGQAQTNTFPSTGSAGIGTTTPASSALLDMVSTSKGLLMPRMTGAQRNAIVSPAAGLMVYQTNGTNGFYFYDGSGWKQVGGSGVGANRSLSNLISPTSINQSLLPGVSNSIDIGSAANTWRNGFFSGNVGIGTTTPTAKLEVVGGDALINQITAGRGRDNDTTNTAFGRNALKSNTRTSSFRGVRNTAIGSGALQSNTTGFNNTANGNSALFKNTKGYENTANGFEALRNNTTGSGNTANGNSALRNNTTGTSNTANGDIALFSNTSGTRNTANGASALTSNTLGDANTANGLNALRNNTEGSFNTANGSYALNNNTTGRLNTANGAHALSSNTTGSQNSANGYFALYSNTTGSGNTANGDSALLSNFTGSNNTALGRFANVTSGSFTNATAIGNSALVDASNKVRIGNTSVTSIGGQVSWTNFSDGRIKKNIKNNVPGLRFINLLKPITYNYDLAKEYELLGSTDSSNYAEKNDIEKINFTGFAAQEVDAAAKKIGYDFSGVDRTGNIWGLRYSEFVVPLVKAVQELSNANDDKIEMIKQLQAKVEKMDELQKQLNVQQQQIDELKSMINYQSSTLGSSSVTNNQNVTLSSSFSLEQNIPNPFKGTTTINCLLPVNNGNAYINFYNQSGALLKSIKVTGEGKNTITLTANELAAGTYKYALVVDGKVIDSKQMVLQR